MMPKKTTPEGSSEETKQTTPHGDPRVFDVAKPGQTAAAATSRPVIVGHGSMIKQDPMVKPATPKEKISTASSKTISPINDIDNKKEQTDKSEVNEDKESVETPEEVSDKGQSETVEDKKTADESDASPNSSREISANVLADKALESKEKKQRAELEEKRAQQVEELVSSKQYFVKIHQGPTGSSAGNWLLGLLLLVAIVTLIAIDAGLVDIGVKLPFDLIKN